MSLSTQAEQFSGICASSVWRYRDGRCLPATEQLAQETPVALTFNGISHAVMLATPLNLEDFALGFAITEGLLQHPRELYGLEVESTPLGVNLHLEVASACAWRLKEKKRSLAGRSGCGLCGVESLNQLLPQLNNAPKLFLSAPALTQAVGDMRTWQALQDATGATHAAAFANAQGEIQAVREDIGRHNALDKLIGHILSQGIDPSTGFVCVTSRASMEMVQKTLVLGAAALAAVSAPTSMAVALAQQHQLPLAAFVRGHNLVAYAQAEHFGFAAESCLSSS